MSRHSPPSITIPACLEQAGSLVFHECRPTWEHWLGVVGGALIYHFQLHEADWLPPWLRAFDRSLTIYEAQKRWPEHAQKIQAVCRRVRAASV
jgi:hypothetical protein